MRGNAGGDEITIGENKEFLVSSGVHADCSGERRALLRNGCIRVEPQPIVEHKGDQMTSRIHELLHALEVARLESLEALSEQDSLATPASEAILQRLANIQLALTAAREEIASQVGRGGEALPEIKRDKSGNPGAPRTAI